MNVQPPPFLSSSVSRKLNLILVEDDQNIQKYFLEYFFQNFNFVFHYNSIEEFYDAKLKTNEVGMILLDIGLPCQSGLEALPKIKSQYPNKEIVIFSSYDCPAVVVQALRLGATGYLLKSDALLTIDQELSVIMKGGAAISPTIARKLVEFFAPQNLLKTLKPKERAILKLFSEGYTYEEVGAQLGLKIDTVRYYVRSLYKKLHVTTKNEALLKVRAEL